MPFIVTGGGCSWLRVRSRERECVCVCVCVGVDDEGTQHCHTAPRDPRSCLNTQTSRLIPISGISVDDASVPCDHLKVMCSGFCCGKAFVVLITL